jgi:hypothetical protein
MGFDVLDVERWMRVGRRVHKIADQLRLGCDVDMHGPMLLKAANYPV